GSIPSERAPFSRPLVAGTHAHFLGVICSRRHPFAWLGRSGPLTKFETDNWPESGWLGRASQPTSALPAVVSTKRSAGVKDHRFPAEVGGSRPARATSPASRRPRRRLRRV